jgi:hypothetical protein
MALTEQLDLSGLRRKVRAAQHVRSVPLIGIGILLVNYGTNLFDKSPPTGATARRSPSSRSGR